MVKEVCEREYEQMIIASDKTHKQYDPAGAVLTPPSSSKQPEHGSASLVADDQRTTERKVAPVERSGSHRQMQVSRPIQPAPREQPLSLLLEHRRRNTGSTIEAHQSHVTVGGRTQQYETAEQVVSQYHNLNFMPQKNEGRDRLEILQKSREFNPVIEFDNGSPFSSH